MIRQPIILQLTKIPNGSDYLAQILMSPRGTSGQERFNLADADEVFKADDESGQTLAQLKAAIDVGTVGFVEMERLGEFLYGRIFTGLVERKLRDVIIQERQRPYRLCIRIDESAPLLETVPWEYMKRPEGFVALGLASVTRVLEDRDGHAFDPVEAATMLLVYANPPGYGDERRHAKIEEASDLFINGFMPRLEKKSGLKITKLLRGDATRDKFLTMLSEQHFDIVHFIGHGELLKGRGNIVMHDNQRIPGAEIYSNLSNNPPRLFYFNSCSTAKANNRDPFSSVAQALLRPELNSVPAVIAMQYEIDVSDSFVLAEEFYTKLLGPESPAFGNLEAAMDAARRKLRVKNSSWGIPVLFLQTRERVMLFGEPTVGAQPAQLKLHLSSSIPPVTDLVDREAEVATVRDLLSSDRRLLMVTGLPGVGRGSIVRAGLDPFLREAREEIVIWLNLDAIKSEDATLETLYVSLDKILETGLKPLWYDSRRSLNEKLAELESRIPNTAILVFENIDAMLDEECHLKDEEVEQFFLHFGKTKRRIFIIATSKLNPKPRGDAEESLNLWQHIKVQGLKTEDAVELLRKEGLTHSDRDLRILAEALSGHPQTLKIVAAGIAQGSANLEVFGNAAKAATRSTGTFADAMLASLTDAESRALKAWSVFRNPVLAEALLQVAENVPDAERIVESLSTKGLLSVKEDYYFLPALVSSVASAELRRDSLLFDDAHYRAAAFFLKEAERTWDSLELLPSQMLETERINNYLEARYHLRERVDDVSKRRAQDIAVTLFQVLMDQGRYGELRTLIQQSEPEFSGDYMVQLFKAQLEGLFGNYRDAIDMLELLYLNVEQGSFEQGSAANEIGVVLKERSDPRDSDEMLKHFEDASDIFANIIRTSDNQEEIEQAYHSQAVCTYNRGLVYQYFRRGDTPEQFNEAYAMARSLYEGSLKIYQTLMEPDEQGIAMVFSQLGELLADNRFAGHDEDDAEKMLRDALAIASRIGKPRIEIDAAYQLARFLRKQGEPGQARVLFRQVADLAERIELTAERAIAEVQIAEMDFADKQYDREMLDANLSWNEETLSYYEDFHSIRVQSDAYFLHGLLHLARDNEAEAIECFDRSRMVIAEVATRSQSRADARRITRGTVHLAQIYLRRQDPEAAVAVIAEKQEHFAKIGSELREDEPVAVFIDRINE